MGLAGRFLRTIAGGYAHWCPGCEELHGIAVDTPRPNGARWSFDGNLEAPTFAPSINIRQGRFADPAWRPDAGDPDDSMVCHYFIRAGRIEFCGDSTHALKGQIVALPELPAGHRDNPSEA